MVVVKFFIKSVHIFVGKVLIFFNFCNSEDLKFLDFKTDDYFLRLSIHWKFMQQRNWWLWEWPILKIALLHNKLSLSIILKSVNAHWLITI